MLVRFILDPRLPLFKILDPPLPSSLAANVVYRFKCSLDANISYIGKTDRHLMTRMKEHLNPNSQEKSVVTKHISQCAHCQDNEGFDNFEILRHCRENRSTFFTTSHLLILNYITVVELLCIYSNFESCMVLP